MEKVTGGRHFTSN